MRWAFGLWELHRHRPEIGLEAVRISGLGEQRLRLVRVEGVVLDRGVVGPERRRDRVDRGDTGAEVDRVHDRLFVDRHVEGLADALVVERLLLHVERQVADVQAFLGKDGDVLVLAHLRQVRRIRIRHRVAFARLELGVADSQILVIE